MLKLFKLYGIASLFSAMRNADEEITRLREQVLSLQTELAARNSQTIEMLEDFARPKPEPVVDEVFDEEEDDDFDLELTKSIEEQINAEREKMYGKDLKPVNVRRTTSDLYEEARKRHEAAATRDRAIQESAMQEEIVEEYERANKPHTQPAQVRISEGKARFYVESAKAMVGKKA